MVADLQLLNTVSRLNATGATIAYGKGVVTDTSVTGDNDAMRLPVLADSANIALIFNGVVMYEINRAQADGAVAGAVDENFGTVATEGVLWVVVQEAVAKDDPVSLRINGGDEGDFQTTADANNILIAGAKFLNAAGIGELAKISFGLGG